MATIDQHIATETVNGRGVLIRGENGLPQLHLPKGWLAYAFGTHPLGYTHGKYDMVHFGMDQADLMKDPQYVEGLELGRSERPAMLAQQARRRAKK